MSRPKRFYRNMDKRKADLIRQLYFVGKLKQADLARMFGITQGSVSRVISGLSWGD